MNVRAKVKGIYTSDMDELEVYLPTDPSRFSVTVRAMVGPAEIEGEESFDLNVCTVKWLEERVEHETFVLGIHRLFVKEYNPMEIRRYITRTLEQFSGATWKDVAEKISRVAYWEFEGYRPTL